MRSEFIGKGELEGKESPRNLKPTATLRASNTTSIGFIIHYAINTFHPPIRYNVKGMIIYTLKHTPE
jgi:hypothetical protein